MSGQIAAAFPPWPHAPINAVPSVCGVLILTWMICVLCIASETCCFSRLRPPDWSVMIYVGKSQSGIPTAVIYWLHTNGFPPRFCLLTSFVPSVTSEVFCCQMDPCYDVIQTPTYLQLSNSLHSVFPRWLSTNLCAWESTETQVPFFKTDGRLY